jgi:hypothetical protein
MHYIFPVKMLKKKGKEAGVGSSSGPEAQKKEALAQSDSEEEEETQPLEHKKRMLSIFPQLPEKSMLIGKDVNEILSDVFITEQVAKKFRTGVSPSKIMNPQPLSYVVPCTCSTVRETPIIHIQDDPEPDTPPSTIITEHPPSPPQPH